MKDVNGKEIGGYRYGQYWFGVTGHDRISGLSGGSFGSENELIDAYDKALGDYKDNPRLIRCYKDGTEVILRPSTQDIKELVESKE